MSRSRALTAVLASIATASLAAAPVAAQHRGNVEICHHAGPTKTLTLHVSQSGADAHMANHVGDRMGSCDVGEPTDS